ncbi:hypothetical protein HOLleu_36612 [Holothuria leucospilota]|uniref:V-SNARE coiled-coil homology domain-containing protein n=1 Tax=Holothuria leucospilota TaxID=206669 RepID=A0A9Q0YM75_HOLLE|nr:hypothetical protein HOLleu_36612 [Holothuria leucospilota]
MEVYAPFYGSVSSSQAINIPQHYTANGTKPSHGQSRHGHRNGGSLNQSKAKRGKKLKTMFRKLKKKNKKKKKDLTENGHHESVSRTSSYGSCSSSSSSQNEETSTSPFNPPQEYVTSCKEQPAKRMSKENRKQEQSSFNGGAESADLITSGKYNCADANSGIHEESDEWKKQSKSKKRKDGQKVYPKSQRLDSSTYEETQRNRVGRVKGIWRKIRKSKKKNKIREAGNLSQLYFKYEDVKGIMTTNSEKLLSRNGKLEDLQDRGEKLVKQCEVFSRHADQIKNEHASWWARMRDALRRLCCCFGCRCRAGQ